MNKYEEALNRLKHCVCDNYECRIAQFEKCKECGVPKLLQELAELVEKTKWHHYPDEKPMEDGTYLIALYNEKTNRYYTYAEEYDTDNYCFECEPHTRNIVAWMPLLTYEEEE